MGMCAQMFILFTVLNSHSERMDIDYTDRILSNNNKKQHTDEIRKLSFSTPNVAGMFRYWSKAVYFIEKSGCKEYEINVERGKKIVECVFLMLHTITTRTFLK